MKEPYRICAERKNKPKCMECTWFKTDPHDLPDFGKCIRNHWNVISSDEACVDFAYPKGGKEIIGKELNL
jgi:hypothetical protein